MHELIIELIRLISILTLKGCRVLESRAVEPLKIDYCIVFRSILKDEKEGAKFKGGRKTKSTHTYKVISSDYFSYML